MLRLPTVLPTELCSPFSTFPPALAGQLCPGIPDSESMTRFQCTCSVQTKLHFLRSHGVLQRNIWWIGNVGKSGYLGENKALHINWNWGRSPNSLIFMVLRTKFAPSALSGEWNMALPSSIELDHVLLVCLCKMRLIIVFTAQVSWGN